MRAAVAMLSRRDLMATAIAAAAAWFGRRAGFCTVAGGGDCAPAIADHAALVALCSDFRCTAAIGEASLRALPVAEGGSRHRLARLILADLSAAAGRDRPAAAALRHAIREQSRQDFRDGKIVSVDGWMLSLTETRVYALAGLLAKKS
jgi:hypothetical protein